MPANAAAAPAGPLLSEHDVLTVVRDALVIVLELDPGRVSASTRIVEDLGADSLALVELAEIIEERLAPLSRDGFVIDDADLDDIVTIGELVDYSLARLSPRG